MGHATCGTYKKSGAQTSLQGIVEKLAILVFNSQVCMLLLFVAALRMVASANRTICRSSMKNSVADAPSVAVWWTRICAQGFSGRCPTRLADILPHSISTLL